MLNLIIVNSKVELAKKASSFIIQRLIKKNNLVLGLATGQTPLLTYQYLIKDYHENKRCYQNVTTFNLDEYIGIKESNECSYHYYMQHNLFQYLDLKKENTFILKGTGNYLEYAQKYDDLIASKNGIDLQILGLGVNGHIGFNEPYTNWKLKTHVVDLTQSTIKANARFFKKISDVPKQAVSMGITSILNAKEILLIAFGQKKALAIKKLLTILKPDPALPCSYLLKHPNVTVIIDQEAAQLLK